MDINEKMIPFVEDLINTSISADYAYHNFNHTMYVYEKAIELAQHEHCSAGELYLLKTAALWHDTGYIHIYYGHEEESCILSRKHLPDFGYTEGEIEIICGIIMATKLPQTPHTHLERIIADADLIYLGTEQAEEQALLLFKELQTLNPALHKEMWDRTQIHFLENHRYFTNYCLQHIEPVKQAYLNSLRLLL